MDTKDNFQDEAQLDNFETEAQESAPSGELILDKFKSVEDLADAYQNLQKAYHAKSAPKNESNEADDEDQLAQLDALLEQRGYVKRDELQAKELQAREESQLLAVDPSAESRLDIVKSLAKTPEFKGKSLADIDNFVKSKVGSASVSRPSVMGSPQGESKDVKDMSDDEFMEAYGAQSNRLSKR